MAIFGMFTRATRCFDPSMSSPIPKADGKFDMMPCGNLLHTAIWLVVDYYWDDYWDDY